MITKNIYIHGGHGEVHVLSPVEFDTLLECLHEVNRITPVQKLPPRFYEVLSKLVALESSLI